MTPEDRKFRAVDAQQLLDNKLFKEAFESVEHHLDMAALTCEPDNKDKAQRIVISKQLLAAVKREITRIVEDGKIAEIQLNEIEKRESLMKRVFRR